MWEKKKILILVKAYPERSKKYGSVICMAGLTKEGEFIRIYPVEFDYFIKKLKIKKFSWIEAQVKKTREKLMRKESYKVKRNTIKVLDNSLSKLKGNYTEKIKIWQERKKLILPHINTSIEELMQKWEKDRTSLGLIKPNLIKLNFRKPLKDIKIEHQKILQKTLNNEYIHVADKIEHIISYNFKCNDPTCKGHALTCEDWELFEAIRKWKYPPKEKELKIKKKFFDWMKKRDIYFYVGMLSTFPNWIIIGLFYPPKI